MNLLKEMYQEGPILTIFFSVILFIILPLLVIIVEIFSKKWDAQYLKETEEKALKIWDNDQTENKEIAWAHVESLLKPRKRAYPKGLSNPRIRAYYRKKRSR